MEGRRDRSFLTIVLSVPISQNGFSSRWGATNHHKNHIPIKPDKFPIKQNLQNDHKTIFYCRKFEQYSTIRQHDHTWTMFDVYGCLKSRGTRSTLCSYWSAQIHATHKRLTAHEREGAYIVKSEVLPPFLEMKICHRIAQLIKTLSS